VGVLTFVLATGLGAQLAVPLPWTPVPITLQPFFVILAGAVLGARLGSAAMVLYVLAGALGAPVFSNGSSGVPWLMGPTGGYLLATPAAAFLTGWIAGRGAGTLRSAAGLTLGVATLYAGGVAQLAGLTGQDLGALLVLGVWPFLAGDALKVLVALALLPPLRRTSLGQL
jgi:biotin transport system substrate-specific component